MTIQDCYVFLDADYENTRKQIDNDEEWQRRLSAFAQDKTFYSLVLRLGERNYATARDCLARLDVQCRELGFTRLCKESEHLDEVLADSQTLGKVSYILQELMVEYERTIAAIKMVVPA